MQINPLITLVLLIPASISSAAPEDLMGTFKGTEILTISSKCNQIGVSNSPVILTYKELEGSSFKANGNKNDGSFTMEGEIDDDHITARLRGRNISGQIWEGTAIGELKGNELSYKVKGRILTPPTCRFNADVKATKTE